MHNGAQALILAGGFGTRMSQQFPGLPKPLIPVNGVPILQRQIQECKKFGLSKILVLLHFEAERIMNYFGDGSSFGVDLSYEIERTPLGTGGAMLSVIDKLSPTFCVLYADVYSDVDLHGLSQFHVISKADVTLVAHPNSHPYDSDILVLDGDDWVIDISAHPHKTGRYFRNMVNAAMYVFEKAALKEIEVSRKKFDIAQDLLPEMLSNRARVKAYKTVEYLKDMGTPERHKRVEADISNCVPESRSMREKRSAVFLDRDGTINVEVGHLADLSDFRLIPQAAEAISKVNASRHLAICVTNQPVLARGEVTKDELGQIFSLMDLELGLGGAFLDDLYYCPHHPDAGFDGEILELKVDCECRKPKIGMFASAALDHDIDLTYSWMIGDRSSDLRAGNSFGGRSILVSTGAGGNDGKYPTRPVFEAEHVSAAIDFILGDAVKMENFFSNLEGELLKNPVICISGLPMSGKTSLASNLKWFLRTKNLSAHILDMDTFLLDEIDDKTSLQNAFDMDLFGKTINGFLFGGVHKFLDCKFDRLNHSIAKFGEEKILEDRVLIIDGVFSHYCMQAWDREATLICATCDEYVRSNRIQNLLAHTSHKSKANAQKKMNIEVEFWQTDDSQFDYIFHLHEFEDELL